MPSSARERALPLAMTMGDPAGIGPEIALKAYVHRADRGLMPFALYGCPRTLAERAKLLGLDVAIREIGTPAAAAARTRSEAFAPVTTGSSARPSPARRAGDGSAARRAAAGKSSRARASTLHLEDIMRVSFPL